MGYCGLIQWSVRITGEFCWKTNLLESLGNFEGEVGRQGLKVKKNVKAKENGLGTGKLVVGSTWMWETVWR